MGLVKRRILVNLSRKERVVDTKKLDSRFFRNVVRWYSMKINHGIDDNCYVGHRGILSQLGTHYGECVLLTVCQYSYIHYILYSEH